MEKNDVYQNTSVAEGERQRGRVVRTLLKNLVHWGFLVKTGDTDSLYRQNIFINEKVRSEIRILVEG